MPSASQRGPFRSVTHMGFAEPCGVIEAQSNIETSFLRACMCWILPYEHPIGGRLTARRLACNRNERIMTSPANQRISGSRPQRRSSRPPESGDRSLAHRPLNLTASCSSGRDTRGAA
jgi:hypothetical protein